MAKSKDRRAATKKRRTILADPERYAGLPLEWPHLWMKRDGN